ncbi:MAG: recombinase family protein [Eggerthella lenta]
MPYRAERISGRCRSAGHPAPPSKQPPGQGAPYVSEGNVKIHNRQDGNNQKLWRVTMEYSKEDLMEAKKQIWGVGENMGTEESKKIWEENAQFWDNAMGDESNEFHREVVRPKVTELLSPNPADYILDIACGNGNYSSYLAQRGASVVAFDYSKKMIELAKRRQSQYAKQIEFCVAEGVRFIAVNDNVDSASEGMDNDFTPLRNLFNEWLVRDTSKKIKAVKKSKGMSGKPVTSKPVYGYVMDEDENFIIDEEAAPVVQQIYQLCLAGNGPTKIARMLTEQQIPTPGTLEYQRTGSTRRYHPGYECKWATNTVVHILENREYTGCLVNFKTEKPSYKVKHSIENPVEKQAIFENHHEPIIDKETWERVQELRKQRKRPNRYDEVGLFSGILFCADCGHVLYQQRYQNKDRKQDCYICGSYKKRTRNCTAHFIRTDLLTAGVLANLRQVTEYAAKHESRFVKLLVQQNEIGGKRKTAAAIKQLEQAQERISEISRIIKRLYEDNVNGKISDERFMELSADYEAEQAELKKRAAALQAELDKSQAATVNAEKFMGIVRKHLAFEELTPTLLREMIEKIVVHECSYDENGTRRQDIEIYYSFVGKIDLPE